MYLSRDWACLLYFFSCVSSCFLDYYLSIYLSVLAFLSCFIKSIFLLTMPRNSSLLFTTIFNLLHFTAFIGGLRNLRCIATALGFQEGAGRLNGMLCCIRALFWVHLSEESNILLMDHLFPLVFAPWEHFQLPVAALALLHLRLLGLVTVAHGIRPQLRLWVIVYVLIYYNDIICTAHLGIPSLS